MQFVACNAGHVTPLFIIEHGKLFDKHRTEECLQGQHILFLGDSVMEELVFDLAILLSGVSRKESDLDNFIRKSTSMCAGTKGCDNDYEHAEVELPNSDVMMVYTYIHTYIHTYSFRTCLSIF